MVRDVGEGGVERSFNAAFIFYRDLYRLMRDFDRAMQLGDVEFQFTTLEAIYYKVCFVLNPGNYEKDLDACRSWIWSATRDSADMMSKEAYAKDLSRAKGKLREVYVKIVRTLDKRGMMLPKLKIPGAVAKEFLEEYREELEPAKK